MKILLQSFALASLVFLTSCQDSSEVNSSAKIANIPAKPLAAAKMTAEIPANPRLGTPLPIKINFQSHFNISNLTINYRVSEGLTSGDPQTESVFSTVAANQILNHMIHVLPNTEDTHTIQVFATFQLANGQQLTEPMTIQFTVGNPQKKQKVHPYQQYIHTDSDGKSTIQLPAEETRH